MLSNPFVIIILTDLPNMEIIVSLPYKFINMQNKYKLIKVDLVLILIFNSNFFYHSN